MVRYRLLAAVLLIALPACNLNTSPAGRPEGAAGAVTATLSADSRAAIAALLTLPVEATFAAPPIATPVPPTAAHASPTSTPTPLPISPTASPSPIPPPTLTPQPTLTVAPALPVPTRTIPGPPTVMPLDDGSGNTIAGTGSNASFSPIPGFAALPDALYYLSDAGGLPQVFRLRIGLNHPDQLTFSGTGAAAFSVAPDGTLAYIDRTGQMIVGGLPILPPENPDGTLPRVAALAYSPGGDWLAFVLQGPQPGGPPTSVWMRNAAGTAIPLATSVDDALIFTGPLSWHPNGGEVIVAVSLPAGPAAARIDITTGALRALWNQGDLPPGSYTSARWSPDATAILAWSSNRLLRLDPDTLMARVIMDGAGLTLTGAWQTAGGMLTVAGQGAEGMLRLYALQAEGVAPLPLTQAFAGPGVLEALWDRAGLSAVIVALGPPGTLGTAYLRDPAGALIDLTPLTGPVGAPQWGPAFQRGDWARVQTTAGDPLNLRATPSLQAEVLFRMVSASRVAIIGGPRLADGLRWWQVRTPDGVSGWAAEAISDPQGQRLRTLLPTD